MTKPDEIFYYWNRQKTHKPIALNDETLRDGLQATYIRGLNLDQKKLFLDLLPQVHIHSVNIGFPSSGPEQARHVLELAKYIKNHKLDLDADIGARSIVSDIDPALDIIDKVGQPLEIGIFIGSSHIRQIVEKWELKAMGQLVRVAVTHATKNGAKVMFITEDTTRAYPQTIKYLYQTAIDSGASRICVSDTVGCATPESTTKLLKYIFQDIVGHQPVLVDWHGHNDRGLAVANSLAAARAGVDRIQATALGIGERAGNTSMEQLIINLYLEHLLKVGEIKFLYDYTRFAAKHLKVRIKPNDPIAGSHIFFTATGVHAAAIKKAYDMNRPDLAGLVYSAIDPSLIGRKPDIKVGPMSGKSNAMWILQKIKRPANDRNITLILNEAKNQNRILKPKEIKHLLGKK